MNQFTDKDFLVPSVEEGIPLEDMYVALEMDSPEDHILRQKVEGVKDFKELRLLYSQSYTGSILQKEIEVRLQQSFKHVLGTLDTIESALDVYEDYKDDPILGKEALARLEEFFMRELDAAKSAQEVKDVYFHSPDGSDTERLSMQKLDEVLIHDLAEANDSQKIVDIYHMSLDGSRARREAVHKLILFYRNIDSSLLITSQSA